MRNHPSTWKAFLLEIADKLDKRNKDADLFLDLSVPEVTSVKSISNLVSEKASIVCYYSSPTSSLNFFQSAADLEGGILIQESKVVALTGFTDYGYPVVVNNNCISKIVDKQVPKLQDLIQIESKDEVANLNLEDIDQSELLSTHPFMILPPFLWKAAIETKVKSPSNILVSFLKRISEYASSPENSEKISEEVLQQKCTRLLQFIWAAEKGKMQQLHVFPPTDDEEIRSWCSFKHEQCIKKNNRYPNRDQSLAALPTQQLDSATVRDIYKDSFEQYKALSSSTDSKKKAFKKLQTATKNMILMASSSNGEIKAGAPSEDCNDFYSQSTNADARTFLEKTLKHKWGCNVQILPGVATSLYNSNFSRDYAENPSNFSPFSFPKKPFAGRRNLERESMAMQLRELSGEGSSKADIENALNQDITIPKQIDFMRHNIKNFIGVSCFFFSHHSILPNRIAAMDQHIEKNLEIYEALQFNNKYFSAEFLFSINNRVHLWLQQCEAATHRDKVDDSLIDFSDDLNTVL